MNNKVQRPTGFGCPVCSGFIPISIAELLGTEVMLCPYCGLEIRINREHSKKAMDALMKVKEAEEGVRKASVFNR